MLAVVGKVNPPAAAGVFARCGTYAPTNGSERIRRARYEVGFLELTFGDELYVSACVRFHRTSGLAGDHAHPELNVRYERLVFRRSHNGNRLDLLRSNKQEALPRQKWRFTATYRETFAITKTKRCDLSHAFARCEKLRTGVEF